jgi:hypothetical protein
MMKDLQRMQGQLQEQIEALEVEGSSGGGMVLARMNGHKQLLSVKLAPGAVTPDDLELVEDLVLAAVNEAGRKIDEEIARLTQAATGGLKMPGMF